MSFSDLIDFESLLNSKRITYNDILKAIINYLKKLESIKITPKTTICEGGDACLDDLDRVELVMDLEEQFNVTFDIDSGWNSSKIDNCATVEELAKVLFENIKY